MAARVLVAYATKLGSTREIAETIGEVLRAGGHEADVEAAATVGDLGPYDAVVLGSALYAAHWQRDANRFVARHLEALKARPVWLFSSGPLDRALAAADLPLAPQAAALTAPIHARGHSTFGGRLAADAPDIDPQVLATHPIGDFRDWPRIRAWAAAIAAEISADLASPANRRPRAADPADLASSAPDLDPSVPEHVVGPPGVAVDDAAVAVAHDARHGDVHPVGRELRLLLHAVRQAVGVDGRGRRLLEVRDGRPREAHRPAVGDAPDLVAAPSRRRPRCSDRSG